MVNMRPSDEGLPALNGVLIRALVGTAIAKGLLTKEELISWLKADSVRAEEPGAPAELAGVYTEALEAIEKLTS
jgi:hypothetical protein